MTSKHQYAIQCDRLQRRPQGEEVWASLMNHASRISLEELTGACDFSGLLDEGETFDDFISPDEGACAYEVVLSDRVVYFLQMSGFEYFFTDDGEAPSFIDPNDPDGHEHRSSALARLLLSADHPVFQNLWGVEVDHGLNEQGLREISCEQGSVRYQLMDGDRPIAGVRIDQGEITDIYTCRDRRREGVSTRLLNLVKASAGPVRFSSGLTDDGKAFKAAYLRRARPEEENEPSF